MAATTTARRGTRAKHLQAVLAPFQLARGAHSRCSTVGAASGPLGACPCLNPPGSRGRQHRLDFKLSDFNIKRRLGEGSFSTVVLCQHRETGGLYAIKIINKVCLTPGRRPSRPAGHSR